MPKTLSILVTATLMLYVAPLITRAAFHEALQERRATTREEIQSKRDTLRDEVRQRREALKKEFEERRQALRADAERLREKFRQDAQVRRDELKKKLGEKRAERVEQFFTQMLRKFEAAIARLTQLADRIAGRLNEAEARGRDVGALRTQLEQARTKIVEAEKALEDAKAKYTEAAKNPDFKAAFKNVREIVNGVQEKVKDAHKALVDVVNSIKGLGRGTATTTPENE